MIVQGANNPLTLAEPYPGRTSLRRPTRHKQWKRNITINPIPSNYGRIIWDGNTLIVV